MIGSVFSIVLNLIKDQNMTSITLAYENYRLKVNSIGGCVDKFTYGGTDIFRSRYGKDTNLDSSFSGLFPMVPIANRIRGNKISINDKSMSLPLHDRDDQFFLHGDAWLEEWDIQECNKQKLCLSLNKRNNLYHYLATLTYSMDELGLSITLNVLNMGNAFPFNLGIHPYYAYDDDDIVHFKSKGYWPEGDNYLPEGYLEAIPELFDFSTDKTIPEVWINNCFYAPKETVRLNRVTSGFSVDIYGPEKYWVVYRPAEFLANENKYICFESQQYPIDAHSQGVVPLIKKGQESEMMLRVKVTEYS